MTSALVHSVVVATLQDKINVAEEEEIIQYFCEVISDQGLLFSAVVHNLSPLLISLHVATDIEDSARVIKTITSQLVPNPVSTDDEDYSVAPVPKVVKAAWKPPRAESYGACRILTPDEVIAITHDPSPKVRKEALRDMCPCHVKNNIESLWVRIIEMANDPDANVRYQVMHNLCDGSPACREYDVIRTLESMHNDADKKVRRRVHQVLSHYRRTGKWNIL